MRVVLAMSGGVDSSVAAHLLLQEGHDVVGVFMRHGEQSPAVCAVEPEQEKSSGSLLPQLPVVSRLDHKQGCCTAADAADARRVSDRLGMPFYALDLNAEFGQIMDYFVKEYARGRTPNPCVQCNNWIKFGKLFEYADSIGAEFVATGHYARLEQRPEGPALLRGVDPGKDQSYVLSGISKELLPRMLLPVGGYQKPKIRELATEIGLDVAQKKDSQEICFVTQSRYDEFVKQRLEAEGNKTSGGDFVSTTGEVLGQHQGIEGFTIGQRKGLGIALGKPMFVVRIDPETNQVVLGERKDLDQKILVASDTNWLVALPQGKPIRCEAQIRYNTVAAPAQVWLEENNALRIEFDTPQKGVTPGQAVVCYDAEEPTRVLGGGWID